jgi:hypothetical protein
MVAVILALPVFEISSEDAWQLVLVECTHLTLSAFFSGELRMLLSIPWDISFPNVTFSQKAPSRKKLKHHGADQSTYDHGKKSPGYNGEYCRQHDNAPRIPRRFSRCSRSFMKKEQRKSAA